MRNPTDFHNNNYIELDLGWMDTGTIARQAVLAINWANPLQVLDVNANMEMFVQGWIGDKAFEELMRLEGINVEGVTYDSVRITKELRDGSITVDMKQIQHANPIMLNWVRSNAEWPSMDETFRLWNRGLIDDSVANLYMQQNGYMDGPTRRKLAELRYEIPSISDLFRWAAKEAFEPENIEEFGMLDEFPEHLAKYA